MCLLKKLLAMSDNFVYIMFKPSAPQQIFIVATCDRRIFQLPHTADFYRCDMRSSDFPVAAHSRFLSLIDKKLEALLREIFFKRCVGCSISAFLLA